MYNNISNTNFNQTMQNVWLKSVICIKLGGGLANSLIDFNDELHPLKFDYGQIKGMLHEQILRNTECVGQKAGNIELHDRLNSLEQLHDVDNEEPNLYFYHSDHLGSSSFITDATGISTQHLQYLPYGELFVEQRATANYFTPYKFSAKEKDEETSYSYFGARYLASDFSFWLSEDPMADKYPNISPYNYCHWNPVRLIDPNGLEAGDPTDFGVKNNGEVVRIGEINNEPDRLFAINDDGTKKSVDPITVNNKTILPELAIARQLVNRQDDAGTVVEEGVLRHTSSKDKQDMAKLFLFMAKNTMKEWSMYFDKKSNNVSLGTYQYEDTSPGPKSYGNESINTSMSIHFHPGETSESEVESLYGDRSTVTKVPYSYYIFMPNSSNLYKLSKDGNKAYIKRNINFETIINILK